MTRPLKITVLVLAVLLFGLYVPAGGAGKLVGVVFSGDLARYRDAHRAFLKVLAQRGYDQGSFELVVQTPNPDPASWANAVRKLNALGADLIVAYGAPAALSTVREAAGRALVFTDVYGPQEVGLVKSLGGDGGTITGVTAKVPVITLIKAGLEVRPFKTLGVLYHSREAGSVVQLREVQRLAGRHGFVVREANITTTAALEAEVAALLTQVDCLYITECVTASRQFEKIVNRATAARVPVLSLMPDAAEKGALLSLEVDPVEQGQLAGDYAVRILGGSQGGQLPVRVPRQIQLVLNMKTARILDMAVPFQVLSMVTKIVK
jgi:putative ABC transport system substrate-binding protein